MALSWNFVTGIDIGIGIGEAKVYQQRPMDPTPWFSVFQPASHPCSCCTGLSLGPSVRAGWYMYNNISVCLEHGARNTTYGPQHTTSAAKPPVVVVARGCGRTRRHACQTRPMARRTRFAPYVYGGALTVEHSSRWVHIESLHSATDDHFAPSAVPSA
jgi:hypothetical protein